MRESVEIKLFIPIELDRHSTPSSLGHNIFRRISLIPPECFG